MKQVSDFFLKSYNEGTLDKYYVSDLTICTVDNEIIQIPSENVSINNNIFTSGGDENGFLLGKVILDTLQLEIINNNYLYDSVNFTNAKLSCKVMCDIENDEVVTETFDLGNWIVISPEVNGNYITLNMARIYSNCARPAWSKFTLKHEVLKAKTVVQKVCDYLGLELINYEPVCDNAKFLFASDEFYTMNNDISTCIQILEVMAYFAAGYIYIDINGKLSTTTYSMDLLENEIKSSYWGGVFDEAENLYMSGDKLNGGYFTSNENTEIKTPKFSNLDNIIHIPSKIIFNFTHNTEYTRPTGIKYGYSGTSVNNGESVTGTITTIAPNKSALVSLKDYYKELVFTNVDNKGTDSVHVILYDEKDQQLLDTLVKSNGRIELYNNQYHAKKFRIYSTAKPNNGNIKFATPNKSSAITNNNYNRMKITGIKDRLGRSYSNITVYLYPYGVANAQQYEKKSVKLNEEISIKDRKQIVFYKGENVSKTVSYAGTITGGIISTGNYTEITINSFTNCSYVEVTLLKSNNVNDTVGKTYKVTKSTKIPLTSDTKYVSIHTNANIYSTKKVKYTLWYSDFTVSYTLNSLTSASYTAIGKVETNSSNEKIEGTSDYLLDVSSLNYPAQLEKQDSDAQAIAEQVLKRIQFPFLIFECDIVGTPIIEVGDIVALPDVSGKVYYSYVTNVSFNLNGFTTIKCVASEVEK